MKMECILDRIKNKCKLSEKNKSASLCVMIQKMTIFTRLLRAFFSKDIFFLLYFPTRYTYYYVYTIQLFTRLYIYNTLLGLDLHRCHPCDCFQSLTLISRVPNEMQAKTFYEINMNLSLVYDYRLLHYCVNKLSIY